MTNPVSLLLPIAGASLPPATLPNQLSDDEQRLVRGLAMKLASQAEPALTRWRYYDGLQRMQNLGISIPPQLAGVKTVVDWPRICVDPLVQRCELDGFRIPGATDVDSELRDLLDANDFDHEMPLGVLDALVTGRGYVIVGSPDSPGDAPVVTVESPLNLAMTWDPRTRRVTAAYQAFEVEGVFRAVLYLPDETISMSRDQWKQWTVDDRDQHNFGEVPVVRLVNRSRTSDREGRSEITAGVMTTTDSACRSLLGMEIAREVYSIPHLWIIGSSESNFVDAAGNKKSALDMAMTKVIALENDEEGNAPTIGQLKAFDPSVFTKIINEHAQLMASYTGFPPSYFGQTSTANPASADAIRVAESGIDRRGQQVQRQFSAPLRTVAQLVWRFANGGAPLPDEMKRLQVDWVDARTKTPAATSDAVVKQVAAGILPPMSDVTLAELGYNDLQRERIALDWKSDENRAFLERLAASVTAKEARSANSAINIVDQAEGQPTTATGEPPAGQ